MSQAWGHPTSQVWFQRFEGHHRSPDGRGSITSRPMPRRPRSMLVLAGIATASLLAWVSLRSVPPLQSGERSYEQTNRSIPEIQAASSSPAGTPLPLIPSTAPAPSASSAFPAAGLAARVDGWSHSTAPQDAMRAYEAVADCLRARSQDRTPQDQIEAGDGSPGLHAPPLLERRALPLPSISRGRTVKVHLAADIPPCPRPRPGTRSETHTSRRGCNTATVRWPALCRWWQELLTYRLTGRPHSGLPSCSAATALTRRRRFPTIRWL